MALFAALENEISGFLVSQGNIFETILKQLVDRMGSMEATIDKNHKAMLKTTACVAASISSTTCNDQELVTSVARLTQQVNFLYRILLTGVPSSAFVASSPPSSFSKEDPRVGMVKALQANESMRMEFPVQQLLHGGPMTDKSSATTDKLDNQQIDSVLSLLNQLALDQQFLQLSHEDNQLQELVEQASPTMPTATNAMTSSATAPVVSDLIPRLPIGERDDSSSEQSAETTREMAATRSARSGTGTARVALTCRRSTPLTSRSIDMGFITHQIEEIIDARKAQLLDDLQKMPEFVQQQQSLLLQIQEATNEQLQRLQVDMTNQMASFYNSWQDSIQCSRDRCVYGMDKSNLRGLEARLLQLRREWESGPVFSDEQTQTRLLAQVNSLLELLQQITSLLNTDPNGLQTSQGNFAQQTLRRLLETLEQELAHETSLLPKKDDSADTGAPPNDVMNTTLGFMNQLLRQMDLGAANMLERDDAILQQHAEQLEILSQEVQHLQESERELIEQIAVLPTQEATSKLINDLQHQIQESASMNSTSIEQIVSELKSKMSTLPTHDALNAISEAVHHKADRDEMLRLQRELRKRVQAEQQQQRNISRAFVRSNTIRSTTRQTQQQLQQQQQQIQNNQEKYQLSSARPVTPKLGGCISKTAFRCLSCDQPLPFVDDLPKNDDVAGSDGGSSLCDRSTGMPISEGVASWLDPSAGLPSRTGVASMSRFPNAFASRKKKPVATEANSIPGSPVSNNAPGGGGSGNGVGIAGGGASTNTFSSLWTAVMGEGVAMPKQLATNEGFNRIPLRHPSYSDEIVYGPAVNSDFLQRHGLATTPGAIEINSARPFHGPSTDISISSLLNSRPKTAGMRDLLPKGEIVIRKNNSSVVIGPFAERDQQQHQRQVHQRQTQSSARPSSQMSAKQRTS